MIQYEYDIITIDRYKNGKKITKHILYKSKKNFIYIYNLYICAYYIFYEIYNRYTVQSLESLDAKSMRKKISPQVFLL